ncbi:MAG: T9SS type A sorting domain-containing protein [Candidatus Kapaibacterium sp.]
MRFNHTTLRLLLTPLILLLGVVGAGAQQARNRIDNRGKEFRVAFLHTNGDDKIPNFMLILACEKRTHVNLTFTRTGNVQGIDLAPNVATEVKLDTTQLTLPDPLTDSSSISKASILVQADDEITLYGVNTQRWSSDVFLGLPNDAVGNHYIVLSYPNTLATDATAIYTHNSDFPSQFAVIATEDNTVVQITPSTPIKARRIIGPFTVRLNAGQVYFAQAAGKTGMDLTGTEVRSDKPVVVYGSHQRANVPYDDAVGRDHLVEQLAPVERWPHRTILDPHYQIPKTVDDANIVRIVAAQDSTNIFLDSVYYRTMNAREVIELPLDHTRLVTSNNPIQVAQFQHSTVVERFISMPNDSIGDPFMMLNWGQEQFDSIYWFSSIDTKDFNYHFINIVIPTERIATLNLDGGPVSASAFSRVAKTSYSFAQIKVQAGSHVIRARAPFGLYIYGYGPYNSYGNPGGVVFDTLYKDQKEPDIRWRDTCGGMAGAAFDDSTHDFGMEALRLLSGSSNITLQTDPYKHGDDSIHFLAKLDDPYQDGYARLQAVDSAGLDRFYNFKVKGFTVAMVIGQTQPILLDTLASLNGMEFCRKITLTNYGEFTQTIAGLRLGANPPGLRVQGEFPVEIEPGGVHEFSICYQHIGDTVFTVEVGVDNGCTVRPVALLPLLSAIDSMLPVLTRADVPCQLQHTISVTDLYARNAGVQSIRFIDSTNLDVVITPDGLPSKDLTLELRQRDPYQDMIYNAVITDAVGNASTIRDTISGFTLAVRAADDTDPIGVRFGRAKQFGTLIYGHEDCDTFLLSNYGHRPLALQRPRILGNLIYSIPPDQLPIVLMPSQTVPFIICVRPRGFGDQIDTFAVDFNCGYPTNLVELKTAVDPLLGVSADRCGNTLRFEVNGFVKRNFIEAPIPNPATERTNIRIGLTAEQPVSLAIYNDHGDEVRRMLDHDNLPGGITQVDAAVHDLPAGTYYLRLQTINGSTLTEKLVIAR